MQARAYKNFARELMYLKRAVLVRRLVAKGERKRYGYRGVLMNIATLSAMMVLLASAYQTAYAARDPRVGKLEVHLAASTLFAPFWLAALCAALVYERLFGLAPAESWYVVLYSMTAAILPLSIGRALQILAPEFWGKSAVLFAAYLASAGVSVLFVYANAEKPCRNKKAEGARAAVCSGMQVLLVLLSLFERKQLVDLLVLRF